MSSDNIKVAVRVRQLIQRELASGSEYNWTVQDNSICCNKPDANGKRPVPYIFDRVFDDSAQTMDIFEEICQPIVDSALAGFNGTIFVYGQSSSGKTFTMSGSRVQPGIISLAVHEIFSHIQSIPDREFLIRVGYLEIYNEKVSDLLSSEDGNLKLNEDTDHNIIIVGMREEMVNNLEGVHRVLKIGDARRHTAETKQNDRSSRSHCILRFVIESRLKGHEDDAVNVSNLYFVDLAGSEKANDNSGDRFREGCAINRSLFMLGMVIRKLSGENNQQSSHVSFRDSKLTRILQNALGGNSKTAIICTITPAHIEESDSTLKFASRAKSIKNKAVVNEVMSEAAMLKRYRSQIKNLQDQIKELNSKSDINLGLEKAELEKRLREKEAAEAQQAEMIAKLQAMIVTAGSSNSTQDLNKRRRRETWCPGKAKRELQELSPPKLSSLREKSLPTKLDEIVIEEEDSFQLLENIPVPLVSNINEHFDADMTIHTNPTMKELFELQDLYQRSLEELEANKKDFEELEMFTKHEREAEAELINTLRTDLKKSAEELNALKANVPWLEEELMKTQAERNSLRLKVDAINAQLGAVADGSGLTKTTAQLKVSENKVTDLNTDLEVQKCRYEFHIQQLNRKLEIYALMLEEKGVNFEGVKARLVASNIEHCDGKLASSSQNDEVGQLKAKHEQELNELRSEMDMLVIDNDKGILKIQQMQREFEEEFEKQKSNYQEMIADAQEEVEIYRKLLEAEKAMHNENSGDNSSSQAGTKTEPNIEALRSEFNSQKGMFELEIDRLKNELDSVRKQETGESIMTLDEKSLLHYQKQIDESQLTEKLNEHEQIVNTENDALSKECQTDIRRTVYFDYSSEIENQKAKYESMIQELVEERDAYRTVLEEMRGNNLQVDAFEKLKSGYDEKFVKVKDELEKYKRLYENESVCVNEEHSRLSDVYGTGSIGCIDLQKEMIQTEMDELKETNENEVTELKREIKELQLKLEKTCVSNEKAADGLVISDNHLADKVENINELKLKHECETNDLQAKIRELMQQLDTEKLKNGNAGMNLQNELLLSKREEREKRYMEEIEDLKSKLSENEEILEKERAKVERILESDDERRTHSEEQANMKQMYEEKITELEEDIKIYIKLLEESKEQSKMEIKDSNENKLTEIIEAKYSDQIIVLQQKLDKFTNLYEVEKEKNESIKSLSGHDENLRLQLEELEENHKKEIEFMKEEFAKFAEEHFQNKSNGTESDIEEIKSKYETEILLLKQQITKNVEGDEQSANSYDLRSELLKAEVDELKEKHKAEIERLNTELEQYKESVKLEDMQNKMLPAEMERLKEKHTNELEELLAKLRTLEEQTAQHTEKEAEDSMCETDEVKQMRQDLEKCRQCLEEEKERNKQLIAQNSECNDEELKMYKNAVEELQEELSNMTVQLKHLPKTIEVLENTIARLKQEKLDLLNARDRFSNRSDEQEQTINSQAKTVETLQNNIKQLQEENAVQLAKITELEKQIKMGKGMLVKRDEKIRNLEAELEEQATLLGSELNEKIEEMKEYVSELESKVQESEELQKQATDRILELENSEAQFSDQIISLEADIDMYKAKEEELSKVCTEYEEKIVHLESDLETMKFKITDLEATCTEQEKKIEALMEDLEIAQSKDIELKDVQCKYQEKLSDLEGELKQSENLRADIEVEKKQLLGRCESLTRDIESMKEQLNKELQERDDLTKLKDTALSKLKGIQHDSKVKIEDLEEKLEISAETVKKLQEEIETNGEQTDLLKSIISNLETERDDAKDARFENDLLKTKIESMELELEQRANSVLNLKSEIETVKGKLSAVTESRVDTVELEKLKAKLLQEITIAEGKLKETEEDRDNQKLLLQTVIKDKELIEKKLEVVEHEKLSLEEDNYQLQRNIHPTTLKYHSLPENVAWEQRWEEFVREEKIKRIAVYSTVRQLKKQAAEAEERQKHAYEEALEELQRKERSSDVYKELEQQTRAINQEANDLYHRLEDEKKKTADLTQRLAELEAKGTAASKSDMDFMTLDHQCKYKWEGLSAVEKLKSAEIEHANRISQYEETIQQYDGRIARMKNEMRRLQTNMDNTCIFDGRSGKIPCLNLDSEAKVAAVENPTNVSSSSETRVSYGSSARGGVVDHFKVVMTEAENKGLKQDLEKLKKENIKVKEELKNLKMKFSKMEELEKENLSLKNQQQKTSGKSNDTTQRDTSLLNSSMSNHPLAEMSVKSSDIKVEAIAIPPSPKKETRLEFPNLNPTRKREDPLMQQCKSDADNCKTS